MDMIQELQPCKKKGSLIKRISDVFRVVISGFFPRVVDLRFSNPTWVWKIHSFSRWVLFGNQGGFPLLW